MTRNLLILFTGLLLAGPAFGASWAKCGSGVADSSIAPGETLCVDLTSGDLTTDLLAVSQCSDIDIIYEPDTTSTGVAITVSPYNCSSASASTNSCGLIAGVTLSGVPPNTEIYGAAGAWVYFVGSGTIGSTTPRILVHCNGAH